MFEWTMSLAEYSFKWYREAGSVSGKVFKIWHWTPRRSAMIEELSEAGANVVKSLMLNSCADLVVRF